MSLQSDWIAKLRYTITSPECDPISSNYIAPNAILSPSTFMIPSIATAPLPSDPIVGFIQEAPLSLTETIMLCSIKLTTTVEGPIVIWGLVDTETPIMLELALNGTVLTTTTSSNVIFFSAVKPPDTYTIALVGTPKEPVLINSSRILALG